MSLRRFTNALSGSPQSSPSRPRLAAAALSIVTGGSTPTKVPPQIDAAAVADICGSPSSLSQSLGSTLNSAGGLEVLMSPQTSDYPVTTTSGYTSPRLASPCLVATQAAGYRTAGALGKKTLALRILNEELGTPVKAGGTTTPGKKTADASSADASSADASSADASSETTVMPWEVSESEPLAKELTQINKQVKLAAKLTEKAKMPRSITGPVVATAYKHRTIKGQNIKLPTTTTNKKNKDVTVSDVPFLLAQWSGNKRNKLISPEHESISSFKKLQWQCHNDKCNTLFEARIADQYVNGGECPSCKKCPSAAHSAAMSKEKKDAQGTPNSRRDFNPELARGWDKCHGDLQDDERLFVSPKLDGIRCVAFNDARPGQPPNPKFISRRGHVLECCDHLNPMFEKLYKVDPKAVFDGELYNHSFKDNFDALGGAVRCMRKHRTPEQLRVQLQIQYHCFGLMYGEGIETSTSFSDRIAYLRKLTQPMEKSGMLSMDDGSEAKPKQLVGAGNKEIPKMVLVSQIECTKSSVDAAYQKHLKSGYEGLMVRFGSVPYQFGKRSKALLKVKPVEDSEYKIVGFEEGQGKWAGSLGALVCKTSQGDEFRVTPSATEETKAHFWKNRKELVGKMMTVQYQALTNQGIPRFPIGKAIRGSANQKDWM